MQVCLGRGLPGKYLRAWAIMTAMAWGSAMAAGPEVVQDCPQGKEGADLAAPTCLMPAWPMGNEALMPNKGATPDLRPQLTGPAKAHARQDIGAELHLSIENLGEAPAAAGFTIEIGLLMTPDDGPTMYRALTRRVSPVALAPHETRQYQMTGVIIPEHFQWGTNHYRLCARIDPANHLKLPEPHNKMTCTAIVIQPEGGGPGASQP